MDILQVRELKQSLERRDARILELERQLEAARQPQERVEAVAWMIDGEPMLEHEVRSTDAESRNDLLARAIPLFLHPTPDSDRVAELEAQLAAKQEERNESSRGWRETFDAMHQRAMRAEKQLTESREREGRMREALNEAHKLMESGLDDTAFKVIAAAVAADKEKNDE